MDERRDGPRWLCDDDDDECQKNQFNLQRPSFVLETYRAIMPNSVSEVHERRYIANSV